MNAQELTKIVNRLTNEMPDIKKEVEFLKQDLEKIRRMVSDMEIDIKLFEYSKRK